MSTRVKERRFKLPPEISPEDLSSLVMNAVSSADFFGFSYQKGKPFVLRTLSDPSDILDDVIRRPDELYKHLSDITEISGRFGAPSGRLVEVINCVAQAGLQCVALLVGDVSVFEQWSGLRLGATRPKPWEPQDRHFSVLNVPGLVDPSLDESKLLILAGADESLTTVNVTRGFFLNMELTKEVQNDRPKNTGGWSFQ